MMKVYVVCCYDLAYFGDVIFVTANRKEAVEFSQRPGGKRGVK